MNSRSGNERFLTTHTWMGDTLMKYVVCKVSFTFNAVSLSLPHYRFLVCQNLITMKFIQLFTESSFNNAQYKILYVKLEKGKSSKKPTHKIPLPLEEYLFLRWHVEECTAYSLQTKCLMFSSFTKHSFLFGGLCWENSR